MARIANVLALLKALGLASWRDLRTFRSIGGQNFFLFFGAIFIQQPASVTFIFVILVIVMLLPLSVDAMGKVPSERRRTWPISDLEWGVVRVGSLAFNPLTLVALVLLPRIGWRMSAFAAITAVSLQAITSLSTRLVRASADSWLRWIPALPGATGSIMRLHWREMLGTLDPYIALALMASTEVYRMSGGPLDPAAPRIVSLLVSLMMSTQTQVLFAIDGAGHERYRQWPLRGWQILLAKDLAFLALLNLLVLPLDFISGFASGVAALTIGHHRSVLKPIPQQRWRFTSGSVLPDGLFQIVALFSLGLGIETLPLQLGCLCFLMWLASLFFYGRKWDRFQSTFSND